MSDLKNTFPNLADLEKLTIDELQQVKKSWVNEKMLQQEQVDQCSVALQSIEWVLYKKGYRWYGPGDCFSNHVIGHAKKVTIR